MFVMVVNFINTSRKPTHVIIGILKIHNIANATMASKKFVAFLSFT
jgi:hypothetical protein